MLSCFDPNKNPEQKFLRAHRAVAPVRPLISLDFLYLLGHETAQPPGRVLLHLPGDMGVGVQREACAVVAQDAGDRLGVHSLLDRQRGEGVPQPVEGDVFGDTCFLQQVFVQPPQTVRAVVSARHRGREHHRIVGMFGVFPNQQLHCLFWQINRPHRIGGLGLRDLYFAVDSSR